MRISQKVESLSLQMQRVEEEKRACEEKIREGVMQGRPTRVHEEQRMRAVRKIRALQSRIGAVAKNEDMVRNAETDADIAGLLQEVNGYMKQHARSDSALETLEDTMDDQDEFFGLESQRDEQFTSAFERYNEGLDEEIEDDAELAEIKQRAAAEAELNLRASFPALTAEPDRANPPPLPSQKTKAKVAGRSGADSWDQGW